MQPISLYSVFHLNLLYSSIEEEQRAEVIEKCYWPLLRLVRHYDLPIGIEASGLTLETVSTIDPDWLDALRSLICEGPCEFIGSGYAQMIGPLVPAKVNEENLRIGQETYEQVLGIRPKLVLVNEQAYSAGLIQLYLDQGFQGMIMEWNNPYRCHLDWDSEWHYLPQIAKGQYGESIPLIWNDAIAFQKFQRYAHGEIELDEYLKYLRNHLSETQRVFPLYGSDAEIFDFRPGRYRTEAGMTERSEWQRISTLFKVLISDSDFDFIAPSQTLDYMHVPKAGNPLQLESVEQPIAVKKQDKYNITRWAVTGYNDLDINTACYRIYELLIDDLNAGDSEWRELCYLWSSDFRTHITEKRWRAFHERLSAFDHKLRTNVAAAPGFIRQQKNQHILAKNGNPQSSLKTKGTKHLLCIETETIKIDLNCRRGLAFDGLWFKDISSQPLIGTLPHGFFESIALGADFYTGHLILESPGMPKVTDLNPVEPLIEEQPEYITISGRVSTPLGEINKRVKVYRNFPRVDFKYYFELNNFPISSLRVGHITLNPLTFKKDTLRFCCQNGGHKEETFYLDGTEIDHGRAISLLVSAGHGIGITNGVVKLGDMNRLLRVEINKTDAAAIGLITYKPVKNMYLYRLALSLSEIDETRKRASWDPEQIPPSIEISLSMDS